MNSPVSVPDEERVTSIAKAIIDVDELISLLRKSTGQAKPWQRQLSSHLATIDRTSQVLRMTITMDRDDGEVIAAIDELCLACRGAAAAMAATRADIGTRAALTMLTDLAGVVRSTMHNELAAADSLEA